MRKYNLPIFIPHRGCPHDCVFCSQRKITGVDTDVTPDDARRLIESFLATVQTDDAAVEVAYFGGSFTGLDLVTQETFLRTAAEFFPKVDGIRLSTRPDYIDKTILDLLQKYGVTTVELGVQSTDDSVLAANNRGHDFAAVVRASELIKERGIRLGHQMMLGMYGSDAEKDMKTVDDIIALAPECVRIYPVVTLKGTYLEELYKNGAYEPYSIEKAARLAADAIVKVRAHGIDVIRTGLHASEDLEDGTTVVAGPYHPAFGEIAESLIYRDRIEKEVRESGAAGGEFVFDCPMRDMSKAVGHRGMNKQYFKEKYGIKLKLHEI